MGSSRQLASRKVKRKRQGDEVTAAGLSTGKNATLQTPRRKTDTEVLGKKRQLEIIHTIVPSDSIASLIHTRLRLLYGESVHLGEMGAEGMERVMGFSTMSYTPLACVPCARRVRIDGFRSTTSIHSPYRSSGLPGLSQRSIYRYRSHKR